MIECPGIHLSALHERRTVSGGKDLQAGAYSPVASVNCVARNPSGVLARRAVAGVQLGRIGPE